ncbi:MAG: hypothetical protein ACYCZ7_02535, partial [Minisyncoccota bacterium]
MNTHPNNQKIITALFVVVSFFSFNPQKALAQVPSLFVPVNDAVLNFTQEASLTWDSLTQHSLNILAYQAGQMALDQITQSTIAWIRGGFNGSPLFAVDPNQFFLELADSVSGGLASELRGLATCDFSATFNNDLANLIDLSTRSNTRNKFATQIRCPFPALNINASDFYGVGARAFERGGGWSAFEASLQDSGNPFGVSVLTAREYSLRQQEARSIQEKRLDWSKGFLDVVNTNDCQYPEQIQMLMDQEGDLDPSATAAYQRQYCSVTT